MSASMREGPGIEGLKGPRAEGEGRGDFGVPFRWSVAASAVQLGALAFDTHSLGSGQGVAHGYGHWDTKTKGVERHAGR